MKKITLITLAIGLLNIVQGQEINLVYQDISSFDSIKTVNDWKEKNLRDKNIDVYLSTDDKSKPTRKAAYSGWEHKTYGIKYKNIPIEYAMLKVHSKDGEIRSINGEYYKDIDINITPTITEKTALEKAKEFVNADKYIWQASDEVDFLRKTNQEYLKNPPQGELVICKDYINKNSKRLCLAYKFEIYSVKPLSRGFIYVDAVSGEIIHSNPIIKHVDGTADTRYSGTRTISTDLFNGQFRLRDYDSQRGNGIETYNMNSGTSYSNATDFSDGDNNWTDTEYNNNAKDNAALDAHWGAMMTYDYFQQIHNRNSFDNQGTAIQNYVHYDNDYDNAFWDGAVMTYGDGGSDFDALTSLDIVGHEIGHGVTEHTANLVYQDESGALNESVSDIWAACIENYVGGGSFFDIWSIGEDIELRQNQSGLRHMWNPKLASQPDTYFGNNWYSGNDDNGGVHTNSGVFNYWFFLLSNGGSGTNDNNTSYSVSGISIEKSEQIVYFALFNYFTPNTNYPVASLLTTIAAQEVFGFCAEEVLAVKEAWKAVGFNISLNIPTNLNISQTITSGTNQTYSAINTIEADNIIEPNTNVVYRAGNSIVLKSGFHAKAGSNFHAYIEECADNFENLQNRISNNPPNEEPNSVTFKKSINDSNSINSLSSRLLSNSDFKNNVKVYPNPTNKMLSVDIMGDFDKVEIAIYNALGELVYNLYTSNKHSDIDLDRLSPNIYFLKITSGNTNEFIKIIKR